MDPTARIDAVTASGWLSTLSKEYQAAILARTRTMQFAAGEPAFYVGGPPGGIFGIVSGSFHVLMATHDGSVRLAHIVRAGVWFGHGPVLMGGGRTLSFSAAEPSTALHLPLGAISELRANDVGFERALGSLAEFNIRVPITAVADLLIAKSDRRVAAVLLRVTDVLNRALPADPCGFVLTQNQLAEMSNVSRSTVNLVVGNFEAKGWVQVSYSRIVIKAPGRLLKFVETGQ